MRIQSTTRILIDLLHKGDEIASVARFAAKFSLPMRLGPSTENSFSSAELERPALAWAFADSAISVCAQAMAAGKSVDDALEEIRQQIVKLGINTTVPFDVSAGWDLVKQDT